MTDVIEIYHAATERIETPDCRRGRQNLDFGQGFYLTDIYDQALVWATRKSNERGLSPVINVYRLDKSAMLNEARFRIFENYNVEWLDFIVACRTGTEIWKEYDYIEGGVADDRVIDTVNLYAQGFISRDRALKNLQYLRPNNQICLLNQDLLNKHLKFIDCLERLP